MEAWKILGLQREVRNHSLEHIECGTLDQPAMAPYSVNSRSMLWACHLCISMTFLPPFIRYIAPTSLIYPPALNLEPTATSALSFSTPTSTPPSNPQYASANPATRNFTEVSLLRRLRNYTLSCITLDLSCAPLSSLHYSGSHKLHSYPVSPLVYCALSSSESLCRACRTLNPNVRRRTTGRVTHRTLVLCLEFSPQRVTPCYTTSVLRLTHSTLHNAARHTQNAKTLLHSPSHSALTRSAA